MATGSYLVEAFLPASDREGLAEIGDRAEAAARSMSSEGIAVRCVSSIYVPGDEVCFLVFDAASPEAVIEATTRAGLAIDRIGEAFR